jgi:hypothetical protein
MPIANDTEAANAIVARFRAARFRIVLNEFIPEFSYRSYLNITDVTRLFKYNVPRIPDNYLDALIVFRVLFETFYFAVNRTYAGVPPSFHSIFRIIPGSKCKLQFVQIVLNDMCKTYCHCEALFDVFAENMHPFMQREHEYALSRRWMSPNNYWKYFFQKSMIEIRIFQHTTFPSVSCGKVVLLCPGFQKKVEEKMEQKHGFKFDWERHKYLQNYFNDINQKSNEHHSSAIRRLFAADPNFFLTWNNELNAFFHRGYQFPETVIRRWRTKEKKIVTETMRYIIHFDSMYSKYAEKYWIRLMNQGCPELLAEFRKHSVGDDTISWIFYWYLNQLEFTSSMSFNDIMSNLVQHGKMFFPSPQPPKIFSDNNGSRRKNCSLVSSPCIPVNYLLEICLIKNSPPYVRPSAIVLAKSFRRKLASREVCRVLFESLFRPINRNFFAGFVKINYRNLFEIATLERKYAMKKQNPVLQKYLSRYLDSKYLILLKNLPFWKVLIKKMFYHRP